MRQWARELGQAIDVTGWGRTYKIWGMLNGTVFWSLYSFHLLTLRILLILGFVNWYTVFGVALMIRTGRRKIGQEKAKAEAV